MESLHRLRNFIGTPADGFAVTYIAAAEGSLFSLFFYPHWTATGPDRHVAMLIARPGQAAAVTVKFREPKPMRVTTGFTLLGWISIGGLLIRRRAPDHLAV